MATAAPQQFVDWHVYERDLARVERQFEQLYGRLDRLANAIELQNTNAKNNTKMLQAEWIRLVGAFVAGSLPTILLILIQR
ncbi:MAG: hypothetical protein EB141_00545 [Verrucomicrobia bacterium]|nr:hypothetical protein [Pseudomonadota bacterium]NBV22558.1 hypothetical protein [Pseudomonadota bacterium]NDA65277.1 hypothetical protein [Verrucomicrobiota bacterium]NDB74132.1 hypothetical protein [Verrucomicrobiota bacterium]